MQMVRGPVIGVTLAASGFLLICWGINEFAIIQHAWATCLGLYLVYLAGVMSEL